MLEGIGQLGGRGGIGVVILGLIVCYFLLQSWNAGDRIGEESNDVRFRRKHNDD
ncbi:hypothetical protein DNHGIG_31610 [Collibacillus ludicampi]|uniref:Uncharacterized protein n=1 Tax=Collibacillus ludicampi TaxID=2771369 RepID=A0AAV4LIB3_9BACL|nr:hypothetical protein [Collibacillus ludicampi]GIM47612.1 hypothetical protein DNHGIG_31610 [Collibacillus ludicampi]